MDSVRRSSVVGFEVAEVWVGRVFCIVVTALEVEVEFFVVVDLLLLVAENLAVEEVVVVRSRLFAGRVVGWSVSLGVVGD